MARLSRGSSIQRPWWCGPCRGLGARVHGGPHRRVIPLDLMDAVDHRSNGPGLVCAGRGGECTGDRSGAPARRRSDASPAQPWEKAPDRHFKHGARGQGRSEGPIRRTREGGSEWEPIKILLEGDENSNKTNAASNTRL
jgi:hypothetical protein